MVHDRNYNRKMNWKHAIRKRSICRNVNSDNYSAGDWYNNLHQYSKNKIHCSCWMCRARGLYKGSNSKIGRSTTEQRELDKMNYGEMELSIE